MPGKRPLTSLLLDLKARGETAFIPYITAGDPAMEWTARQTDALERAGAHMVELGVPFSDPVADGPVNQRAAERSLAAGTTLTKVIDFVKTRRRAGWNLPVVLFTYYNPLLRMGLETFASRAEEAGVDGVLVVDLPPEEGSDYMRALNRHGVETVFLASPTTTAERLARVDRASTGFVYYVSRLGVTGRRESLSETVAQELQGVRKEVENPVVVGFGISTPEHVRALRPHVEGIVVGSALVRFNEEHAPERACAEMERLASSLVKACTETHNP
jgi:tryptophan synthase alpha chain